MIVLRAPPLGYDVLSSVGVGAAIAAVAPRNGFRLIASIVVIDAVKNRARLPQVCNPTPNMPCIHISPPQKIFQDFFSFNSKSIYTEIGLFDDVAYLDQPSPN